MNLPAPAPLVPPQDTDAPGVPTGQPGQFQMQGRTWNWTLTQRHRARAKGRVLKALEIHGKLAPACREAKVSRSVVYAWMQQYPAFKAAVNERLASLEEDLAASLKRRALNPDDKTGTNAAIFLLKAENREKYGDQTKIDQTVTVNQQVQVVHEVRDSLREQQRQALASLRTLDAPPLPPTP